MGTLFISLLTLVLLVISVFVILIVLMQRTSQSGGMGAALGGGAAESAFGSETNNVLTKGTVYGIIAFFLVALGLYLFYQAEAADRVQEIDMATLITSEEVVGSDLEASIEKVAGTVEEFAVSVEEVAESVESAVNEAATSVAETVAEEVDAAIKE